ncbi:hypothetical protein [Mycobacteroides abscessus]|uniref:hypothetical protein n=1 Tax=Mycobacteroides abscessus TaxID=36809 RepID=UPI00266BBF4C|nr:hypothetical protein [Mycobacteroides abscessus]MDO3331512.1 hypothetical protein [Mycobacteroides abscessus subsp. abscessus]
MPVLTFQNSFFFGDFVRYLRDKIVGQPRTVVHANGGPSVSLQNDIETSKDIPITEETLSKYSEAFDILAPGSAFFSFFEALGAGMFHINSTGHAVNTRRHEIRETLSTWGDRNEIYLGVDIKTGEDVRAHALAYPPREDALTLARSLADRRGPAACITPLLTLALRHPALTLIPQSQEQVTRAAIAAAQDPHHLRTVHTNPERNLDPLAGVTSLQQARQRAQVLGADPDSSATAWIILLANAIGAERNHSPLLSWIRYQTAPAPWAEQIARWGQPIQAGLPGVEAMLPQATKTLEPWAHLYGDSLFDVQFTPHCQKDPTTGTVSTAVKWDVQEVPRPPAPSAGPDDIWIYDSTATSQRLGHVLHDMGVSNIIFADEQYGIVHSGSGFKPEQVLYWCPLGPSDDYALIYSAHHNQPRWRAVQLA